MLSALVPFCSTVRALMQPWQKKCEPTSAPVTSTRALSCRMMLFLKLTTPLLLTPRSSPMSTRKNLAWCINSWWQDESKLQWCPSSFSLKLPCAFNPNGEGGRCGDALRCGMGCSDPSVRRQAGLCGACRGKRSLVQLVRNDDWRRLAALCFLVSRGFQRQRTLELACLISYC